MNWNIPLEGNSAVAAALLIGTLLGVVLVRARLADREAVEKTLLLRNGAMLKTLVGAMLLGVLCGQWLRPVSPANGTLWCSIGGGLLAGIGLFLTGYTPGSGLAAFCRGKFHTLWILVGGALAVTVGQAVSDFFHTHLRKIDSELPNGDPETMPWDLDSPRFYLALALLILLVLIFFTSLGQGEGKNSSSAKSSVPTKSKSKGKK